MSTYAFAALSLAAGAYAQGAGKLTAEVHPKLTTQTCTASGCTTVQNSITLDANWRWVHSSSGTNCYTGNTWDATLCPDPTTCAENCYLDGAAYQSTYGITTSGSALTLQLKTGSNVGSRTYLMDSNDQYYNMFNLKGQEFTFDVDVSKLPCGLNGALYFVAMAKDGGESQYPTNTAGAAYGTGYCDAQCPQDIKFIDGVANIINWTASSNNANTGTGAYGTCCTEMDIWEANSISTAFTPHPCTGITQTRCETAATCGSSGLCDKAGCDFNSYRMGNTTFYGPGDTIDSTKPMTVVTQFITDDGTTTGTLTQIKRLYVQNGIVYQNSVSDIPGVSGNSISDSFCTAQKTAFGDTNTFASHGGMAAMGDAWAEGMVLVMSLWDDYAVNMLWLDSDYPTTANPSSPGVARGTCSTSSGKPADVESQYGSASVTFSNIKTGPIGSTYSGTPGGGTGTGGSSSSSSVGSSTKTSSTSSKTSSTLSTKTTTTTTTTKTSSSASTTTSSSGGNGGTAQHWGQCGGQGWTGPTVCASPYTCTYSNPYYSQCL